jgi:transcription initiation factor TFIID subunit TAF12
MIYLLTATGLSAGGSNTVHIYTQTVRRTTQITTEQHKQQNNTNNNRTTQITTNLEEWKSAGRAPSLRVLPWHLPYN